MPLLRSSKKNLATEIKINLIPKDPFFNTPIGKILRWALSVGRYIVIFTELLVILSFVARFSLDRQVTNLNDSIHQKKTVIESYGDLESRVRLIQVKTDQYQQIEQQTNIVEIFPALTKIIPRNVKLEELSIKPAGVVISGQALSQQALNTLINNFQLSADFFNIKVNKIEAGENQDPGFSFLIGADTKQGVTLTKAKK